MSCAVLSVKVRNLIDLQADDGECLSQVSHVAGSDQTWNKKETKSSISEIGFDQHENAPTTSRPVWADNLGEMPYRHFG